MLSMSMSLNIADTAKMSSQNYCVDEALDDIKMMVRMSRFFDRSTRKGVCFCFVRVKVRVSYMNELPRQVSISIKDINLQVV